MRINESHPIAKHLIGCWFPAKDPAMNNIVNPHQMQSESTSTSTTRLLESGGIRLDQNCSLITNTTQPSISGDGDYLWFIKYQLRSLINQNNTVFGNRKGGTRSPLQFVKFMERGFQYYNNGGSSPLIDHPRAAGVDRAVMVVKRGNNFTLYLDGAVIDTRTFAPGMDPNPVYIGAGDSVVTYESTNIRLYFAMHGPVAPSPAQVASLYADPEQVLYKINDDYYRSEPSGGAFTLTGESGSYTYTGTNAELDAGFVLGAISGSYTYSGTNADLNRGYPLPANSGSYTYSGTDVTLTFAGAGAFTLTADLGSYTYSGTNAELDARFVVTANSGSYTYSGTTVTLTHNYPLAADSGSYTYSGTAAELDLSAVLAATSGAYAYAGSNVTLQASGQTWTVQSNDGSTWAIQSNDSSTWTIQ